MLSYGCLSACLSSQGVDPEVPSPLDCLQSVASVFGEGCLPPSRSGVDWGGGRGGRGGEGEEKGVVLHAATDA